MKGDLVQLLELATKEQLLQFNGTLCQQMDGVVMGSPLGPPIANVFICCIEEKLQLQDNLPEFYDDTLTMMPALYHNFLIFLVASSCCPVYHGAVKEQCHSQSKDTVEISVYVKPTYSGLLLHQNSRVDARYKKTPLQTMLH